MDADDINDAIENVYDIGEDRLEDYLLGLVLGSFGVVGGFLAIALTPIIRKVIKLTVFRFTKYIKRKGQKRIDIIEGQLIVREVDQAVEAEDEDAYVIAIGEY